MRPFPETNAPKAWIAGTFAAALALLGACAQRPETVAPTPVDEARYEGLTCAEMGFRAERLNRDVALLSAEQGTKRVNDVVGWTHLLAPAGTINRRDVRPWLALSKGELAAIERTMARRCPVPVTAALGS